MTEEHVAENPYESPEVDVEYEKPVDHGQLNQMPFDKLKKLYYRSSNIQAIGGLMAIGTVIVTAMVFNMPEFTEGIGPFVYLMYAMLGFNVLAVYCMFARPGWGRIVASIACVLMILNININIISILFGIVGLVALTTSPQLFGEDRITHKEIKTALNDRKRQEKLRKKQEKEQRKRM